MSIAERVRRGETVHLKNRYADNKTMDVVPVYDHFDMGRVRFVAGFSFFRNGKPISKDWYRKSLENLDYYIEDGMWEERGKP